LPPFSLFVPPLTPASKHYAETQYQALPWRRGCCHAAVLPELGALLDLLSAEPQWRGDAVGVAALIMTALRGVADAYAAAGDPTSATVVLEAGLRK
jgi:hypothetical protein